MTRFHLLAIARLVVMAALVSTLPVSSARAAQRPHRPESPAPVRLLTPLADERVAEPTARLVVDARGVRDVEIVLSREPFDPAGWTEAPNGPGWIRAHYSSASPTTLASLAVGVRVETPMWWAAIGRDRATGALRASEVRRLVLVPAFANREAAPARLAPSASGVAPAPAPAAAKDAAAFRPIPLASGDVVRPDLVTERAARVATPPAVNAMGRRASLVEFAGGTEDEARARIGAAGGEVVAPLAGDAWLVRGDEAALARLADGADAWVGEWRPEYKRSALLDRAATGVVEVTALLFADGDDEAVVRALGSLGATGVARHTGTLNHLVRFSLPASRLGDVAALADVEWMEPTAENTVLNDQAQWVTQTGAVGSRRLWDLGLRGHGQVVMTSDSGIRTNHEMFFDSTLAIDTWGDYPTHRKLIAYKRGSNSTAIQFGDDVYSDYHGTHTAGTVAGNADNSSGAPWSGMAKDAKLYFMDMSGPTIGGSLATPDDLNDLFEPSYVGNAGGAARISSNSWGNGRSFGYYMLQSMQVDQFMWTHPDYLVAFAAGNVGVLTSVQAPGTAKNCITVGATGNGALANQLAGFSSGGPTTDARFKPTLCGPGDLVTSSIGSTRYTYATYSGTSMATPAVAGTLALMREYLTEGWYPTGAPVAANAFTPSAALLKAMAVSASRNDVIPYSSPNNRSGWGRIVADDVLYFPGDSSRTRLVDGTEGLLDRQWVEYQVQVTNPSRPLKVALCWTDAPGNPASAVQIVNDLDLSVSFGGTTWLGNRLVNFGSITGGSRDSLNVEEVVHLWAPTPGLYTVRIDAHRVRQGPQPFGLCITGGVGGDNGALALDRFEYALTDTVAFELLDANAATAPVVTLTSTTEPWGERVTTSGGSGIWRGRFPIGPAVPRMNDGVLAVSSGDRVTVTYADGSPVVTIAASASVNAHPPIVSDVHATPLSPTSALVTWTTDIAASTRLRWGTGAPTAIADSSGLVTQHAVRLGGLAPATTYRYDVESATRTGAVAADSLGGAHRSFTTSAHGDLLVVMDDPSPSTLATWTNALGALGWTADVITNADDDPPLVGDSGAGLRHYAAVLWQVDPDRYPPFSDAQRAAIDSLLDHGGRLLVTGHDMGWGLSDMGSPTYSPEREAWIESGLKTRYFYDISWVDTLRGYAGDPVTGDFVAGVKYHPEMYPDAGDVVVPAPGTDGVGVADWLDDNDPSGEMGIHWESNAAKGTPGLGVWGGQKSRLVGMFYEWRALSSTGSEHQPGRTGVLERAVEWLLGHRPPRVTITSPAPGAVVTSDFLPIRWSVAPDAGRAIVSRSLSYSLDGGESWAPMTNAALGDSGTIWDLGAALGGVPVPNASRVLVRLGVTDDGAPAMRAEYTLAGTITLARASGDTRGPVLVAGSAGTSPSPIARGATGALVATFSDTETGAGVVTAAEYSLGASAAPAGSGRAMSGAFGTATASATVVLDTNEFGSGEQTIWLRARDGAGNWGPAAALAVTANDRGVLAVGEVADADFLAPASPNPSLGTTWLRFGLARPGDVRLELFDLAGRRVRTLAAGGLAAGPHVTAWDGRDEQSHAVRAGVYFVRLVTPERTFQSRLVRLD